MKLPGCEHGHGRIETRTLKTAHVRRLDFPCARQAIKITRRRQDTATGKTSARPPTPSPVTFGEDTASSRTGSGPANLATVPAAITATIKEAGYLRIPEGRRDMGDTRHRRRPGHTEPQMTSIAMRKPSGFSTMSSGFDEVSDRPDWMTLAVRAMKNLAMAAPMSAPGTETNAKSG